jgi:hypothetical protein
MAVDHDRIAQLLGEEQTNSDLSLRAQSYKRATTSSVPKTLTPHEWEQWYAQHGIPDAHRRDQSTKTLSWWRRLLQRKPRATADRQRSVPVEARQHLGNSSKCVWKLDSEA